MGDVEKFRRLKHGAPRKFKVLAEDLRPRGNGLPLPTLLVLAIGASLLAYAASVFVG